MTPEELAVLFSGHITAFFLVWFTSLAERVITTTGKAPRREQTEHLGRAQEAAREEAWNVGMFFTLKKYPE
jgi:hypothetical protein